MYGNYDYRGIVPVFEIYLGENLWGLISFINSSTVTTVEMILKSDMDYVDICLVNINLGIPFISALEIRPLRNDTYLTKSGSLLLLSHLDIGSTTGKTVR